MVALGVVIFTIFDRKTATIPDLIVEFHFCIFLLSTALPQYCFFKNIPTNLGNIKIFFFFQYDATRPGSKREPPDQKNSKYSESGYAPTNGAVLVLLKLYGHLLKSTDYDNFIPWLNFVPVE